MRPCVVERAEQGVAGAERPVGAGEVLVAGELLRGEGGRDQGDVDLFVTATDDFRKDPATAAIFLNKGDAFKPGQRLVQDDLASTLRAISESGEDGFYKGAVGAAIVPADTASKSVPRRFRKAVMLPPLSVTVSARN